MGDVADCEELEQDGEDGRAGSQLRWVGELKGSKQYWRRSGNTENLADKCEGQGKRG